jgi:hypothetical protein
MHRRCAADKSRVTINKRDVFNAGTNDGRCFVKSASSWVSILGVLGEESGCFMQNSDTRILQSQPAAISETQKRIAGSSALPASATISPGISDYVQDGPRRDCRILVSRRSRVIAQFSLLMLISIVYRIKWRTCAETSFT